MLTTAVDPRYRLDFFLANLKQKVVRILKSEVQNHKCCDPGPKGSKAQIPKIDVPKNFLLFYSTFKLTITYLIELENCVVTIESSIHL